MKTDAQTGVKPMEPKGTQDTSYVILQPVTVCLICCSLVLERWMDERLDEECITIATINDLVQ